MSALADTMSELPPQSFRIKTMVALGILLGGDVENKLFKRINNQYGPLVTVYLPILGNIVFVLDPRLVREVITGSPDALVSGRGNALLGFLYGRTSMLLVDGAPHRRLRRLLVPPFRNKETLGVYAKTITEVAHQTLDSLPVGKPFSILPELRHGMLEIILRVVFGVSEESRLAPFRDAMTELLDLSTDGSVTWRFIFRRFGGMRNWRRLNEALKKSNDLIYSEIARRRADPATNEQDDILALLLRTQTEDGDHLSDVEIRDQLVTLLIAGHETTATTLAWTLERLMRHPGALAHTQADLAVGSHAYADAVFNETLRLRPPIPVFSREVAGDFSLGGYQLPPKTLLIAHTGYISQRADLFPEPQKFDPDRFIGSKLDLGVYSPFGGGLHSCIGNKFAELEVRLFLEVFLKRGVFKAPSLADEKQARKSILNLPGDGCWLTLVSRS